MPELEINNIPARLILPWRVKSATRGSILTFVSEADDTKIMTVTSHD